MLSSHGQVERMKAHDSSHLLGCFFRDVQLPELLQKHRVHVCRTQLWSWLLWWLHVFWTGLTQEEAGGNDKANIFRMCRINFQNPHICQKQKSPAQNRPIPDKIGKEVKKIIKISSNSWSLSLKQNVEDKILYKTAYQKICLKGSTQKKVGTKKWKHPGLNFWRCRVKRYSLKLELEKIALFMKQKPIKNGAKKILMPKWVIEPIYQSDLDVSKMLKRVTSSSCWVESRIVIWSNCISSVELQPMPGSFSS